METLDGKEILRWAVLSAVLVVAAFAGRSAVSVQGTGPQPRSVEKTIDGVQYRLRQVQSGRAGEARVVVEVSNETDDIRLLRMELQLSEVVYSGSAMSRVQSPDDYKETVLDHKTRNDRVLPRRKNSYPASLKGRAGSPLSGEGRFVAKFLLDGKPALAIDLVKGF